MANENTTPDTATPATPTATAEKPLSAFKQRQIEKGRDSFIVEGPQELVDMMRAAAHEKDDMSLASWVRFAVADAVNAANLTHDVDGATVDWKFDLNTLDESKAKRTTKGLSPEKKKEVEEKKKAEQKEERETIKEILRKHKALLAARNPQALAIEEEARKVAAVEAAKPSTRKPRNGNGDTPATGAASE